MRRGLPAAAASYGDRPLRSDRPFNGNRPRRAFEVTAGGCWALALPMAANATGGDNCR